RNGIHIIDLRKTLDRLQAAQKAVRDVVHAGDRVLFVCTKEQLRDIIETEAERCGSFYVTERWLGGMLTNFRTIKNQIRRLKEIERGQEENAFDFYTKKERLLLDRERQKLEKYLSGVKEMNRLPGAVFVVDAKREIIAVREANRLDIPVIAITDTNADPDLIDYPIPGNDDAIRSVSLITRAIATAVEVARSSVPEDERRLAEEMEATTYSTETGEVEVEERPRRKKKRKRVPRPEIIERRRRGAEDEEEDLGEEEDEIDVEEEGVVDAAPEVEERVEKAKKAAAGAETAEEGQEAAEAAEAAESSEEDEEEPRAEAEADTEEAEDEEAEDTDEKEG
ncbi:MAG: 30S ribosomal protein S2, partial [Longimicrobiales bacterium]|nr:30S ribosomal protein S2 [Longimicrobiales bacterium]